MSKSPGYETRDVDVRRVAWMTLILLLVVVAAMVAMEMTFGFLADRESRSQPPPASLTAGAGKAELPPAPRLQTSPLVDLQVMLAEEEAALESWGWVDEEAGIARIPVDEAMELLVETRGLPVRQEGTRQ